MPPRSAYFSNSVQFLRTKICVKHAVLISFKLQGIKIIVLKLTKLVHTYANMYFNI